MEYQHRFDTGEAFAHSLGKIVCVGRNYGDHARELNNPIPDQPLLFIKPATAAVSMADGFGIPADKGACHFETELAVLVGQRLTESKEQDVEQAIAGVGLAFDLTLRDLQSELKSQGHPWEKAKAFDGSCPLSTFVTYDKVKDIQNIGLRLTCNGDIKQDGNSNQMLTPVFSLLAYISQFFTLLPGDVVLTGTPAGVGALTPGDKLRAELIGLLSVDSQVKK